MARERKLPSLRQDTALAEEYLRLSLKFQYIDTAKSNDYFRKYLKSVTERSDSIGLGKYYYYQAGKAYYAGDYERAIDLARVCMKFTRDKDEFLYLEVTQPLMRSLYFLKKPKEAEQAGQEVLHLKKYQNLPIQLAKVHFNMGIMTMSRMKDSSLYHLNEAVSLLRQNPDNKVLLPCYHYISLFYRNNNRLDSALHYAYQAYALSRDSSLYNNVDFIAPAANYQELLERTGQQLQAQDVARELLMKQYDLKVKSIIFPEVSKQVSYLEYLRLNENIRFILLLIVLAFFLVGLFMLFLFNRKMRRKQTELSESLELNRILMRETNHRVKNNFQMMMSMLSVNAEDHDSVKLTAFIEQTRAKIASMATVHELFLKNQTSLTSDVRLFFQEIIQSLESSLSIGERNISIGYESQCDSLRTDKLLPLGLILNELVVNSVKHAFSGGAPGKISIALLKSGDHCVLQYSDEGPGMKSGGSQASSSGLSIVFSLAKQMKGEARILNEKGSLVEIAFKP